MKLSKNVTSFPRWYSETLPSHSVIPKVTNLASTTTTTTSSGVGVKAEPQDGAPPTISGQKQPTTYLSPAELMPPPPPPPR